MVQPIVLLSPLQNLSLSQHRHQPALAAWEKLAALGRQGSCPHVALVTALFLLCRPFLERFFLCQERHEYSVKGKTLIALALQPSNKDFPVSASVCGNTHLRLSERISNPLEGAQEKEEVRLPCN